MIFSDDSDFRKAKRALMITSSIAVLMVVTGLPVEQVNFGVIVFNLEGSRGIYWFLLAVLVYQSYAFFVRTRVHDITVARKKQANVVAEENNILNKDYIIGLGRGLHGQLEELIDKLNKILENENLPVPTVNNFLERRVDEYVRVGIHDQYHRVISKLKDEPNKREASELLLKITDSISRMKNVESFLTSDKELTNASEQERFIDIAIPMLFGLASLLSLLIYLIFY